MQILVDLMMIPGAIYIWEKFNIFNFKLKNIQKLIGLMQNLMNLTMIPGAI